MSKKLNIYQRLSKVREAVAYIQKDEKLVADKYRAVTHDAVTAAVRKPFIEQGVLIVPKVVDSNMVDSNAKTGRGFTIWRYEAKFDIAFVNIDSPDDRIVVSLEAHAMDEGDKAPGKAMSYATKYAMLKLLNIETGEDEESRVTAGKPEAVEIPKDDPVRKMLEDSGSFGALQNVWQKKLTKEQRLDRGYQKIKDECKARIAKAEEEAAA